MGLISRVSSRTYSGNIIEINMTTTARDEKENMEAKISNKSESDNQKQEKTESEPAKKPKKALTPAEALKLLKSEKEKSKKSNTILSKTKSDWKDFTKRKKITSELKLATKSKNSFLENSDFLARTQAKKDDLAREARIKGMGKI